MSFKIEVTKLCKTYGLRLHSGSGERIKRALVGVTFAVQEGERVGIIGSNGAGKSTLLQVLAGVSSPTSGSVHIEGKVHAALTLGVGLREELSGRANLRLEASIQGMTSRQIAARVEDMVAFADLGDFIDRPVRTYSSGMKSRLTFANLVFVEPEILIVDETLSAGDQFFQRKATQALRRLCARGSIVILVSHSMSAIRAMCSRCIWLDNGQIIKDGPADEVTAVYEEAQEKRVERQLVSELRGLGKTSSRDARLELASVAIGQPGVRPGEATVSPSEPLFVEADIKVLEGIDDASALVRIERLDGVEVTTSRSSLIKMRPGRIRVKASMARLSLGPGYYLAHFEIYASHDLLASSSEAFHVRVKDPFIGGTPMLAPAISARALRRP